MVLCFGETLIEKDRGKLRLLGMIPSLLFSLEGEDLALFTFYSVLGKEAESLKVEKYLKSQEANISFIYSEKSLNVEENGLSINYSFENYFSLNEINEKEKDALLISSVFLSNPKFNNELKNFVLRRDEKIIGIYAEYPDSFILSPELLKESIQEFNTNGKRVYFIGSYRGIPTSSNYKRMSFETFLNYMKNLF